MESFDLADVLARLRVSHDHRVDHDPAKVVQHADEEANLTGIKINPWAGYFGYWVIF